jgi:uncharacterized protein
MKHSDIFICKMCGDCCKGYGGTYVSKADVAAISAHIRSDPRRFVADFCKISGGRPVLRQGKNGYCIFWDRKCTIHPVKPKMCREWPYIESVLIDASNWKIMADSCPGIQRDAPEDLVRECVRKERTARNRR